VPLAELLVERQLYATVEAAERAVLAGDVLGPGGARSLGGAGGAQSARGADTVLTRPRMLLDSACELRLRPRRPYVSRGGEKLAGALASFSFDPCGLRCLDVGASTGGFTDCLLKQGAASVVAVDVAYGQFAWALRNDARVTLVERTNIRDIRDVADAAVCAPFDLVVADLSFTPVRTLLAHLASLLGRDGVLVVLVKPQFELPPDEVGAGGVVTDPAAHARALDTVLEAALAEGLVPQGLTFSPLKGAKGNIEFFFEARRALPAQQAVVPATIDTQGVIARAHAQLD
jgi:23S rRNA (cytidine1920-2'-O)/16S rRNA (cytidine1409-2'-O)-methyltransferase